MRLRPAIVMLWFLTAASFSAFAGSAAPGLVSGQSEAAGVVLGIDGTSFTINGRKTFLLGASYYGALAAPDDFIARDLDDLKTLGFNWIRVWAVWDAFDNNVSAVQRAGASTTAAPARWSVSRQASVARSICGLPRDGSWINSTPSSVSSSSVRHRVCRSNL